MLQSTLTMGDIIGKTDIPKNEIAFIRHALNHKNFYTVWNDDKGDFFEEYQKIQGKDYFHGKKYIFSFVSDKKTTARFIGVYKVEGVKPLKPSLVSKEYWEKYAYIHNLETDYYFDLRKMDILEDLQNRLVIDFVSGTNPVHVKWEAISKKAVISISSNAFPGYENVKFDYRELEGYVKNKEWYDDIVSALSRVNGVYLIVDRTDNKQYIGAAYGENGIWGRWESYVTSNGTGGNEELIKIIKKNPKRRYNFRFSILSVVPRTGVKATDEKNARDLETLYKEKLFPELNRN